MTLRRNLVFLLVLVFSILFAGSDAHTYRADSGTVLINEYPVFTLKASLDGWSPAKRATSICETLKTKGAKLPLTVTTKGADLWIYSDQTRIVRVTPQEAALFGVAQKQLLEEWKAAVETALSLPALLFEPEVLDVPVDTSVVARVVGTEALNATPMVEDNTIAICKATARGIEIEGIEVGETTATVTSPNAKIAFKIKVSGASWTPPTALHAEVAGMPASAESVSNAVRSAIERAYADVADVRVEVLRVDSQTIPSGVSRPILAVVRSTSPDTAPITANVTVNVRNVGLKLQPEVALWYCNDPETVKAEGLLYNQSLEFGSPTRMLYHHMNGTGKPLAMQVVLYNLSSIPARVHAIVGDGEPNTDPVRTGAQAGAEFLKPWLAGTGDLLEVPGRSGLPIAVRVLSPGEVMSGLAHLNLLADGPQRLLVRCEAVSPSSIREHAIFAGTNPTAWSPGPPRSFTMNPPEAPLSNHVYKKPFHEEVVQYEVGGKQAFVRLGESTLTSADTTVSMRGCYGVIFKIEAVLKNPSDKPANVEAVFEASAGYAGLVFALEGKLMPTGIIQSKSEQRLAVYRLQPGESRTVHLVTTPLSGSSYPGTLTFRTVQAVAPSGRTFDTDPGGK